MFVIAQSSFSKSELFRSRVLFVVMELITGRNIFGPFFLLDTSLYNSHICNCMSLYIFSMLYIYIYILCIKVYTYRQAPGFCRQKVISRNSSGTSDTGWVTLSAELCLVSRVIYPGLPTMGAPKMVSGTHTSGTHIIPFPYLQGFLWTIWAHHFTLVLLGFVRGEKLASFIQWSLKLPFWGGIKCMQIYGDFEGCFPYNSALFGLVI